MLNQIKAHLNDSIERINAQKDTFVSPSQTAFTRQRGLSFKTMIRTILGMGGKTLAKELLDANLDVSNSAFVQRRYHIKSEAFYTLFKEFSSHIPVKETLPILAADGSDVCIPRNPKDSTTSIQTHKDAKSYNLIHLNALYDLHRGVYVDIAIQDKRAANERLAVLQMMETCPFQKCFGDYG